MSSKKPSKKPSKKAVVRVTDDDVYDWVKTMYNEEELEPECLEYLTGRKSWVFKLPCFKEMFLHMRQYGKSGHKTFSEYIKASRTERALQIVPGEELDLDVDIPITFFQNMTLVPDFVIVDAMIRLGADTDLKMFADRMTGQETTTLSRTCEMIERDRSICGHIHPGRTRIIRRLLQVGVDPNIGYALHSVCEAGDLKTAALLLEYGADSSIVRPHDGKRPHQLLPIPLRKRFQKLPRTSAPPKLCWCLEGKPLDQCHGNAELPKECDPFFGCPCRSGKTYGICCQKQGVIYTESRDHFSSATRSMVLDDAKERMFDILMHGKKPTDRLFDGLTDECMQDFRESLVHQMMRVTTREQFDPAYGHAVIKNDFFPTYSVGLLPKNEMLLRRDEWNAAIDDYVATRDTLKDDRDVLQIEQQSKILWDGTRRYKECAGCGAIEDKVGEFKGCCRCKMRQYCSKECQVLHWRSGHKQKCSNETEDENETLYFPSHKSLHAFTDEYASASLEGKRMEEFADEYMSKRMH